MKMSMIRIVIYWLIVVGLLRFELHNFSLFETLHSASQVIIIKHTRDGQKSVSKDKVKNIHFSVSNWLLYFFIMIFITKLSEIIVIQICLYKLWVLRSHLGIVYM